MATLAEQLKALRVTTPAPSTPSTSTATPLAVFVTPSTRVADNLEVRTNGAPPKDVLDVFHAQGMRFARTSSAWYGNTRAVEAAVEAIAKLYGDGTVGIYENPSAGIAAWSATPQRSRDKDAKRSGGNRKAGPASVTEIIAEAQQLAQTIGASLALAIETVAAAAGLDPAVTAKVVALATGPRSDGSDDKAGVGEGR